MVARKVLTFDQPRASLISINTTGQRVPQAAAKATSIAVTEEKLPTGKKPMTPATTGLITRPARDVP